MFVVARVNTGVLNNFSRRETTHMSAVIVELSLAKSPDIRSLLERNSTKTPSMRK
jgi:hypothetical protein